ncbi:DUF3006 domain-containing protein [Salibacterium lacus]|uniref:DUF3006 domain-containing protein n=1 Tax=Salibacterium lacus TaxID=1898109 RepID=A0ABW5T099_9BACI
MKYAWIRSAVRRGHLKQYTVDRLEGELAVLLPAGDENIQRKVPTKQLPEDLKEGDVVEVECNENGTLREITINHQETENRKQKAQSIFQKLKNKLG